MIETILHPERFGTTTDIVPSEFHERRSLLERSEEYQDLFNLLHSMGLIATVAEMDEIIRHSVIVKTKIDYKNLTQV